MAGGIIYLDIDDEITSAASRIRSAEGSRAAIVLPNGSRVATSRINFRLLARDAMTNGKRLSVVAPDPATRALAASAGLPIFATVGEYESSLADGRADAAVDAGTGGIADWAGASGASVEPGAAEGVAADDDEPMLVSETVATPGPNPGGPRGGGAARGARARSDTGVTGAAAGAAGAGAAEAAGLAGAAAGAAGTAGTLWAASAGDATTESPAAAVKPVPPPTPASGEPRRAIRTPAAVPAARVVADTSEPDRLRPTRPEPAERGLRSSIGRTPIAVALGVLVLALVVVGAGAFLFLPTATASIQPRVASIGPVPLRIVASTTATAPDPAHLIVPARVVPVPVEASDTFPATGKRTEETKAHGSVRFDNLDPTSSNTIPKGSVVSTGSGIRFSTDKPIRIPPANLVGLTIVPSTASVKITAVDAGTDGNVEPHAITNVPRDEEPFFLKVTNPEATTGGTHKEFPRVKQEDVDKATAALMANLTADFDAKLTDPALTGDTSTVFPETKTLGALVFGVNPATLVGKEVETFDLAATASGTVVAVDTAPVKTVAEAQLTSSVDPGYALIDGSSNVEPAPATVTDGVITFPVTVSARQVLVLDTEAIKREIMGKPLQQAREILATYGEAQLDVWPAWVGTVPTLDSRVEVTMSSSAR